MNETNLFAAASLHLTGPIVDAQDPQCSTSKARLLRHLIAAAWVELEAPTSPMVWLRMLDRLAQTFGDGSGGDDDDFDDFDELAGGDDDESEVEDFLALAAGQVGLTLGMLIASTVEVDSLWRELTTTFAVLDRYLGQAGAEPFFTSWLAEVRGALSTLAQDTGDDVAARAREMLDSRIAGARPVFTRAYQASVADRG
jgi:hypothetical protein